MTDTAPQTTGTYQSTEGLQTSFELSPPQAGIWFVQQLLGGSPAFNVCQATRLSGPLDRSALSNAVATMVARHPALRTAFGEQHGSPSQVVFEAAKADYQELELPPEGSPATATALNGMLRQLAAEPFDLSRPPLMRVRLLTDSAHEHVLVIVCHHLVFDGWSARLLIDDLSSLYHDGAKDSAETAPPYSDHVRAINAMDESETREAGHRYWRQHLQGHTPLKMPTDRARSPGPGHDGNLLRFEIHAATGQAMRALAGRLACTNYMVLLSAYAVALRDFCGTDDIGIASPLAGRTDTRFARTVGLFANTLVLRLQLNGAMNFGEVARLTRTVVLGAVKHQLVPYDQIARELGQARRDSADAPFGVGFSMQEATDTMPRLEGLSANRLPIISGATRCDFWLTIVEEGGTLSGEIEYDGRLFEPATVAAFAAYFQAWLRLACADSVTRLDALRIAEPMERATADPWHTERSRRVAGGVLELFLKQAARNPDATAVICGGQQLSYGELEDLSGRLASELVRLGARNGQPVAVQMERSSELIVAFLASLRSGGAYFPIDPEHPPQRRAFMLRDSGAQVLITDCDDEASADVRGLQVLRLSGMSAVAKLPAAQHDPLEFPGDAAAYLIYTSGSTGEPKGVINLHGGLTNHILWLIDALKMDDRDRMLFKTSIGFDPSVHEVLAPLCSGGVLVIAEPGGQRDIPYLVRTIRDMRVTLLQTVPSALRAILADADADTMASLRLVICGGEALPHELAAQTRSKLPSAVLGNFYGPTEASCDATFHVDDGAVDAAGNLPIGLPIANVRVRVMPATGAPRELPDGAIGELCIGGAGLARGYLNRADLTAARFPADPFLTGERLYRTGDLVRRRGDGRLEFLGRCDTQIKLRGFRIDPGEIEVAMREIPHVTGCVVILVDAPGSGAQLTAFYTGEEVPNPELMDRLRARLPSHMVPNGFVHLREFPLLPGGKVDRPQLGKLAVRAKENTEATPARSPLEEAIWTIWREVLPSHQFGVHDNFFDIGGHSLLATRVLSRVRGTLGMDIPIRAFLEHPTIAELATLVAAGPSGATMQVVESPIASQPREVGVANEFPVSFSQRRMWFVQAYEPDTTAYNMPFSLRLVGPLDLQALDSAFHSVARRHEAFRTTFPLRDGEPIQCIGATPQPFPLVLRSFEASPDPGKLVASWFREETLRPFDLKHGPLHRVFVARISPREHAVLWLVHHVIGDQWSAGLLYNELLALYQAKVSRRPIQLPELPIQYADFAVWQRRQLDENFLGPQLAYWRGQLRGIQPLNFPALPHAREAGSSSGAVIFGMIPADLLARLRELSAERGATPYMTLLAVFNLLLARFTGQTDIAIGSPIANRHHQQAEGLVGTLVNTLVMRTDVSGDPTFSELLSRVRGVALDGYLNQDVPYERLVEEHAANSGGSRAPLVQVLFNVVNAIGTIPHLPDLKLEPFEFDPGSAQFDLTLSVNTEPDADVAGRMGVSYSTRRFNADSMQRFLDRYLLLLSQVVAQPDRTISQFDLLLDDERRQLDQWNHTWTDYPVDQRMDQLFATQALSTPNQVAVEGSGTQFTYGELDFLSNRIAGTLLERGAGPGWVIGIHLDRTPTMVAALLGVMRTGAAYVPLDPSFPLERLQFMVADAGVRLMLTHSWLKAETNFNADCVALDLIDVLGDQAEATMAAGNPGDLAYVLYTSGSTGKPKGVEISHGALTNFLCSMRREPGFAAGDRLLAITTLSFDISGLELYLPLICGGTVILASSEEARDGRLLKRSFERHQPTVMQATPSTWRMLLGTGWTGAAGLRILCGGEPLPSDLARALLERCGELWNVYGPTETTIWSTCARITSADDIHIGRPIANTTICIVGPSLEPTPPGWIGELCIGGHGLAHGYHGRPDLTAQRFVSSPLPGITGDRMYRTGDLARQMPDGRLVHLGRSDFQVKIRGYRIELGEIEAVLIQIAAPAQAVVTARDDSSGNKQLVAYLVPHADQVIDTASLRQTLREHLPDYMVPAYILTLPSLPLTANRKVDVGALPNPSADMSTESRAPVSPRGRMEVQLTALWRQVLNDDTLGVEDNFFERGGHSLLAVQLASQIERVTGLQLPLATLFEAPTVASMARLLTSGRWTPSWRSLVAIQSLGRRPPLFLVPGVGGNVLMFAALARRLGNDQPVYGLQARGLDDAESPLTSIVRIARIYISEMRAVRPRGPWFIAGACTGGVIAFEMTRQLRMSGEQVHLVLMDSWHPVSAVRPARRERPPGRYRQVSGFLARVARKLLLTTPVRAWRLLRRVARSDWRPAEWQAARARHSEAALHQSRVAVATWRAVSRYRPPPIRGNLLHIIASERHVPDGVTDTRPMWLGLAMGEARSVPVAATDSGQLFVAPQVDAVAELLREYLDKPATPISAPRQP